jgi:23S rRNA (uridine2552-2'-O)-methyltransferase
VGKAGKVVGIDLKPVEPVAGATVLEGNIEDQGTLEKIAGILGGKADVVLSDLAPNVSGVWDMDHARQISLSTIALDFARHVLRDGGSAVFKVFEGDMLSEFRSESKSSFSRVLLSKPTASRRQSSELYIVCLELKNRRFLQNQGLPL